MRQSVTAFAPASVANVAVGFDVLGFAIEGVGDRVTVSRAGGPGDVSIASIDGVVPELPREPSRNTATAALLALARELRIEHGFEVAIHKGIPLGSGMGGSAASAVAAVVAANALADSPLPLEALLPFCLEGEKAASGAAHADNAAASLFGGLVGVTGTSPPRVVRIPVPPGSLCALVHPHLEIETRQARSALPAEISLQVAVEQSMYLCAFLAGCYEGDSALAGRSLVDRLVEPTRAKLIPGFEDARAAALRAGALGLAISGSGPSVFAWCADRTVAPRVVAAVVEAFGGHGLEADSWIGPVGAPGAKVKDERPIS